ncbi:MAG TPA: ATP-binding protein [Trichocoleus sp.]|jgi:predicted AAA+ superfamily ATPase
MTAQHPSFTLRQQIASLLLYQSVLQTEVGRAFLDLLQSFQQPNDGLNCLQAYGRWFNALAATGQSWQTSLLTQVLQADNAFTRQVEQVDLSGLPPALLSAAKQDLRTLQHLYTCPSTQLSKWVQAAAGLPVAPIAWDAPLNKIKNDHLSTIQSKLEAMPDWADALDLMAAHYRVAGSGLFAIYHACRWQTGQLVGIACPDQIQLETLVGYETQKETLIKNTDALLAGYPALHVLLYGSRGSGKSSLVKALLQAYRHQGLRVVEVAKADLQALPEIIDRLRDVPQKFIVFVDDLSFEEDDDAYKALKVVLEGNLTARPQNVVVYATSNRRHLIREFFGDRPRPSDADEIHTWDTLQEKLSFSDRFGLTLTFNPADQSTYLEIVRHLAQQAGIQIEPQDLEFRALQWATRHNGRSGRTARQFVDFLQAEIALSQSY